MSERDRLTTPGAAENERGASGTGAAPHLPRRRPCPACGSRKGSHAVPPGAAGNERPAAIRCAACSLVFIDPVPPEATEPACYGDEYYEPWQEPAEAKARLRLWRRRLAMVKARKRDGVLLDVGCGDGLFLKVAGDAGFSVEGIEFSPAGARLSARRLGRPVAVGDLSGEAGLRGPFDVVTLWHVVEHLRSPAAMLEAVRARLRPGGLLVVAVPNLDNLPMRAAYRLARGRALPLYEPGDREPHLSHFNAASLRAFLRGHRFEGIEIAADRCALTPAKRIVDGVAAALSFVCRRFLTDAIVAFAWSPR